MQLHQIELVAQNEELKRLKSALEQDRMRYFKLYELDPVGYCTISDAGLILQANLCAANLLGGVDRGLMIERPLSDLANTYSVKRKVSQASISQRRPLPSSPINPIAIR